MMAEFVSSRPGFAPALHVEVPRNCAVGMKDLAGIHMSMQQAMQLQHKKKRFYTCVLWTTSAPRNWVAIKQDRTWRGRRTLHIVLSPWAEETVVKQGAGLNSMVMVVPYNGTMDNNTMQLVDQVSGVFAW